MRRVLTTMLFAARCAAGSLALLAQGDGGYKLVPNWPKLPAGMYFGLKEAPPPPAERDAQAAARRASGRGGAGGGGGQNANAAGPTNQPGISGLAIDQHDHIYVFNRGVKPVMVFDTDGNLILVGRRSGDQRQDDQPVVAALGRRRLGRQRLRHRTRRAPHRQAEPEARQVPAAARHDQREGERRDAPEPAVGDRDPAQRQHDRHRRLRQQPRHPLRQDRQVHQAGRQRAPAARPTRAPAPGEWNLPHKLAVDAQENLYIIDREGHRVEVFDKNLNYIREIKNDWNPWDINISRKGTDGIGWIADHKDERVLRFDLKTARSPRCGASRAGGPASSTGSTASSSTRRARSTPPTPTVSGFRSSCERSGSSTQP